MKAAFDGMVRTVSGGGQAGPVAGPWLRYRHTGLHVFPYRHHAPEFAALPLLAGLDGFDTVCLELPDWLPVHDLRQAVLDTAPATGGVLLHLGEPEVLAIPEYEGDSHLVQRPVQRSTILPITPDAMISVLRMTGTTPAGGPSVAFVDAGWPWENAGEEPERGPFPYVDAQEVFERGLQAWYGRWLPLLQATRGTPRDAYREAAMAQRVHDLVLAPQRRGLLICGALHWHRIEALLDAARPSGLRRREGLAEASALHASPMRRWLAGWMRMNRPRVPARRFTVCRLDPAVLFSLHMMDIPYVSELFERQWAAGALHVDRQAWIRRMVATCWERTGRPVPVRALTVMEAFLQRRLQSAGRWSCDLDMHLLPCVSAAAGRSFAYELEREAMRYTLEPSGAVPEGRVVRLSSNALLIFVGHDVHLVGIPGQAATRPGSGLRPMRIPQPASLTGKERDHVGAAGLMMKPPCEERLHRHMCDRARDLAHAQLPRRQRPRSRRFAGKVGWGLDVKRSLRTHACGEPVLYVQRPVREAVRGPECVECPVVWVFKVRCRIVERVTDFFEENSRGRRLLTSFFWFHERETNGPVRVSRIAWFVRLYRNLTPSWDRERVERLLISQLPEDRFCTERPWDDGDLDFERNDPDLAVACAVKWSVCDHVTVVRADPAYRVGTAVQDFARERGVRLLDVDAAGLDRILLARYAVDYEVPTRGSWHPPDPIASRLVEPVPGFGNEVEMPPGSMAGDAP